jgi:hypothetical protein
LYAGGLAPQQVFFFFLFGGSTYLSLAPPQRSIEDLEPRLLHLRSIEDLVVGLSFDDHDGGEVGGGEGDTRRKIGGGNSKMCDQWSEEQILGTKKETRFVI